MYMFLNQSNGRRANVSKILEDLVLEPKGLATLQPVLIMECIRYDFIVRV